MQKKVPYVAQLGNMDCSIACMTMLRLDISFVKEIMTKMLKKLFDIDPTFTYWGQFYETAVVYFYPD